MEEELVTLLSGALGIPVAWGEIGQGTALPRVALYRVGGRDDMHLTGRTGWLAGRVQIDCYAETYAGATTVSRAVTQALSGYTGGTIWRAAQMSIRDLTDTAGGETIHRVSMDFAVEYTE